MASDFQGVGRHDLQPSAPSRGTDLFVLRSHRLFFLLMLQSSNDWFVLVFWGRFRNWIKPDIWWKKTWFLAIFHDISTYFPCIKPLKLMYWIIGLPDDRGISQMYGGCSFVPGLFDNFPSLILNRPPNNKHLEESWALGAFNIMVRSFPQILNIKPYLKNYFFHISILFSFLRSN